MKSSADVNGFNAFNRFFILNSDKTPYAAKKGELYDPGRWMSYDTAVIQKNKLKEKMLGFAFTEDSGLFFIDLDDCLDGAEWSSKAKTILNMFPGCYVEVSQSGCGLHIVGTRPEGFNIPFRNRPSTSDEKDTVEFYIHNRYVALSQTNSTGDIRTVGKNLKTFVETYCPAGPITINTPVLDWDSPRAEWDGPKSDKTLIKKMLASQGGAGSVFGDKLRFSDLWERNEDKLSTVIPGQSEGSGFNWSSADIALCGALAFWTGCHGARMDKLFRTSQLMRAKWDRDDYRQRTIEKAISSCRSVYNRKFSENDRAHPLSDVPPPPPDSKWTPFDQDPTPISPTYPLLPGYQIQYFQGCVLITDINRIYTPDGSYMSAETFNATYGGPRFKWRDGDEKFTKKAWEAFTLCEFYKYPRVHTTYFRPELDHLKVYERHGRRYLNTYLPIPVPRRAGDHSLFLELIVRMYPDLRDQKILLTYLASILQRPGKKAQWAVILQGAKGNGKTTLIKILNHAISDRYVHIQDALDLGNKFNIWMRDKLLIVIDELKVPRRKQTKFMTRLKPLITNDRIAVQGKGKDQTVIDNRANFFMATNHKNAIPITENNRRFCMLAAAQQDKKDLKRDGLTKPFFLKLYAWLNQNNKEGFDVINEYLMTYDLGASEFNFDICIDAPVTSVTPEVIELSRSPEENAIREAIENETIGFRNYLISSYQLNAYLKHELSNTENSSKLRTDNLYIKKILKKIGYIPHPGLPGGRMSSFVSLDGNTKPRMYVKKDSPISRLTDPKEIRKIYEKTKEIKGE